MVTSHYLLSICLVEEEHALNRASCNCKPIFHGVLMNFQVTQIREGTRRLCFALCTLAITNIKKATKAHNFNFDKFDFTDMPSRQLILATIETR